MATDASLRGSFWDLQGAPKTSIYKSSGTGPFLALVAMFTTRVYITTIKY